MAESLPSLLRKKPIVISMAFSVVATSSTAAVSILESFLKVVRKISISPNFRSKSWLLNASDAFSRMPDAVSKASIQFSRCSDRVALVSAHVQNHLHRGQDGRDVVHVGHELDDLSDRGGVVDDPTFGLFVIPTPEALFTAVVVLARSLELPVDMRPCRGPSDAVVVPRLPPIIRPLGLKFFEPSHG